MPAKKQTIAVLIFASTFASVLFFIRMIVSQSSAFDFMLLNLLLAWIPFVFSSMIARIVRHHLAQTDRIAMGIFSLLWLLFLPNAPYMVTDFIHLRSRALVPMWYDILLLTTFTFLGFWLWIISVRQMHHVMLRFYSAKVGWVIVGIILALCCFGVGVGRFMRWNSWDVLLSPQKMLSEFIFLFWSPYAFGNTVGLSVVLFFLLGCVYVFYVSLEKK